MIIEAMSGGRWSRDEFLVTLDLYLNTKQIRADKSDPAVKNAADLLGRTPGSIALRIANYTHLDPSGTQGMENTGAACREIWEEFYGNEEELHREAKAARERLSDAEESEEPTVQDQAVAKTGEASTERKSRRGQHDFRQLVRDRYGDTCLLCDVSDPGLLQAGHILDWSEYEDSRGDPANGILLCYTHHRAFDLGLFTISPEYEIAVRPEYNPESEFLRRTLLEKEGTILDFPTEGPDTEYLAKHNENGVYWWTG
jgi:hypothetical protein